MQTFSENLAFNKTFCKLASTNDKTTTVMSNLQEQAKAIAEIVRGQMQDKEANGEFVQPKEYELKEYFNSFNIPVGSTLYMFALAAL